MRRIETAEQKERKHKRNVMILSVFMLAILVFGTVGYAFSYAFIGNGSSRSSHAGTSVVIGSTTVPLINSRKTVSEINVTSFVTPGTYSRKPLYIVSTNNRIISELASTIGQYSERVQEACYGSCNKNLPIKNCTSGENIIIWKDSQTNNVYQNNSCVFIEGDMRAVDAFIYHTIK